MMTAAAKRVSFVIQADSLGQQEISFVFAYFFRVRDMSRDEMHCYLRKYFLFPYVFKLNWTWNVKSVAEA